MNTESASRLRAFESSLPRRTRLKVFLSKPGKISYDHIDVRCHATTPVAPGGVFVGSQYQIPLSTSFSILEHLDGMFKVLECPLDQTTWVLLRESVPCMRTGTRPTKGCCYICCYPRRKTQLVESWNNVGHHWPTTGNKPRPNIGIITPNYSGPVPAYSTDLPVLDECWFNTSTMFLEKSIVNYFLRT